MKKGDILLISNRFDFIGYLIRKVIKSEWNHVAWAINDTHLIEVIGRGIIICPLTKYINKRYRIKLVRIVGLKEEPLNQALHFALGCLRKYSYWNWVKTFTLLVFGYKGKLPRMVCSGLIALALSKIGWYFRKDINPLKITPADISQTKKMRLKKVSYELPTNIPS